MRVQRTQFEISFLKDASDTSHTSRDEQNDGHLRAFGIHCEPGAAIAGEVKSGNTCFHFSLPRDRLVVVSAMKCGTLLISASGKVFLQVHLKCFYWPSRSRKFTHFMLSPSVTGNGLHRLGLRSIEVKLKQRWIFLQKTIFLHGPQKWPCTRIQEPLVPGQ